MYGHLTPCSLYSAMGKCSDVDNKRVSCHELNTYLTAFTAVVNQLTAYTGYSLLTVMTDTSKELWLGGYVHNVIKILCVI